MNWYLTVLKKYAVFSGRARRKEYWMFALFNGLILLILGLIDKYFGLYDHEIGIGLIGTIYTFAVLLPSIGVTIRRLHDIGRSGWWLLIALIPFIGILVLIIFNIFDSEPGTNKYGDNPKGVQKEA